MVSRSYGMSNREEKDFLIRGMPVSLYELLEEFAKQDRRSVTAEILYILEQYCEKRKEGEDNTARQE